MDNQEESDSQLDDTSKNNINTTWFALAVPYLVIGIISLNGDNKSIAVVWFSLAFAFFALGFNSDDDNDDTDRSKDDDPLP